IAGVAQTNGHWITVTQAQLAQTTFVAGQSGASDTLIMVADDRSLQGDHSVQVSVGPGTEPAAAQLDVNALYADDTFGSFCDLAPPANGSLGGGATPPEPPVHTAPVETGFDFSHDKPSGFVPQTEGLTPDHHMINLSIHDVLMM